MSALSIVGLAYAANAVLNHTAWGLALKSHAGVVYVFAFYLPFGVVLPPAYLGWIAGRRRASARWLGAAIGCRGGAAVAPALVVGGFLAMGALGNEVQLAVPSRRRWSSGLVAVVCSLAFGGFHLTYPAPGTLSPRALGLTLVWLPLSLLFVVSRSLVGAVVLNNLMTLIGFVTNGLALPERRRRDGCNPPSPAWCSSWSSC